MNADAEKQNPGEFLPPGVPHPPEAPEIERKLQFYRLQMIGVPLIMLIPVLALAGLFGITRSSAYDSGSRLSLEVQYPARLRYAMRNPLQAVVRNTSDEPLKNVIVKFERAYIEGFSEVTFTPQPKTVTQDHYEVELSEIAPGETRIVAAEVKAEAYGSYQGTVAVDVQGKEEAQCAVETVLFP